MRVEEGEAGNEATLYECMETREREKKTEVLCVVLYLIPCSAMWPPEVRGLADSYMKSPFQVSIGSLDLRVSPAILLVPPPLLSTV